MKHRALALILALCLTLAVLPGRASAAAVHSLPEPMVAPAALPELALQPTAQTYKITMSATGPGKAELYTTTAGAKESVYFLADPDPGYKVSFEKCGYYKNQYDMRLIYIGDNVYEIVMPDGDVMLDLEFVKITTSSHKVKVTANKGGTVTVDQNSARKGESIFVEIDVAPGYSLETVKGKSAGGWNQGYYLGRENGVERYEIFMPDEDLDIQVTFKRNGPYTITPYVDVPGGRLELSHTSAYELETVTVTAVPDRGYAVNTIGCFHSALTRVKENVWTFSMPRFSEEVHVSFMAIRYPVQAVVEAPVGGVVLLDRETATIGQTVTVTCVPNKGYRTARITGAELTPGADENTWTFVMDNEPVELKVLFLRENNPFLDVTENDFYHDPVIWAVENGITNGVSATHFGPFSGCNRAQVVTFLWRAAGSPAPTGGSNPFTDVSAGTWYTDAVLWAVENGITNGVSDTRFGPDEVCNRAQVVTFLWRAAGSPVPKSGENPFGDVPADSWFTKPVLWALENGVTTGYSATSFDPEGECLRGHVVTFLYRADQIPEPAPDPLPFPDLG